MFRARVAGRVGDFRVKVSKTQITFAVRYGFAFVSLRRLKGCPPVFLLLTIGLARRLDSPRDLMLLGFYKGELAGSCALASVGPFRRRVAHRCEVSIALYQKFCGKGIGTAMMTALLAQAKAAGYEQAELTVMAENRPAVALYERLGFVRCGTLPHNMKYADGRYADAYWMQKSL